MAAAHAAPADPLGGRIGRTFRLASLGAFLALCVVLVLPDVPRALWVLTNGLAGAILVARRPANVIGWLLLLIAVSFTGIVDLGAGQAAAIQAGTAPPLEAFRIWVGAQSGMWAFLAYGILGCVFPTGSLAGGPWRPVLLALIGLALVATGLSMVGPWMSVTIDGGAAMVLVPNPVAIAPNGAFWTTVADTDITFLPIVAVLGAGAVSVFVRAVRSTGVVRLQMRWLAASLGCVVAGVIIGFAATTLGGEAAADLAWLPASAAFLTVPIAVTVAVLRHRLLDIDRVVSRTIGWALATGVLVAIFLGGVAALQAVLVDVTQGDTLAVAVSTLLAAACFQPVRTRLQSIVDRQFDRAAYDRDRVVAVFGGRLRDELDLATIERELAGTAIEAVRPTASGVWIRQAASR